MAPTTPPYDRVAVLENLGGDEDLLVQIAELFVADWPQSRERLRRALAAGDVEALRAAAHAVKGAVANFGAEQAVQAAKQLEMDCRAGTLSRAPSLLDATETAIDDVVAALKLEIAA